MSEFDQIYSNHFPVVYKYVYSLCRNESIAEEITQETFFKAMKSIESFRGECKLLVWLCQIAKNTYYSYYDKLKTQQEHQIIIKQSENRNQSENIEQSFVNQETALEIHKVLHGMEEPYKEVFTLRVFGELSFVQIGKLFDKSESWARVTYYRAKVKLKERMG